MQNLPHGTGSGLLNGQCAAARRDRAAAHDADR